MLSLFFEPELFFIWGCVSLNCTEQYAACSGKFHFIHLRVKLQPRTTMGTVLCDQKLRNIRTYMWLSTCLYICLLATNACHALIYRGGTRLRHTFFFQIMVTFLSYISNACHSSSGVAERLQHTYGCNMHESPYYPYRSISPEGIEGGAGGVIHPSSILLFPLISPYSPNRGQTPTFLTLVGAK